MTTMTRTELYRLIDTLPDFTLPEMAHFVEFISYKLQRQPTIKEMPTDSDALQTEINAFKEQHSRLKEKYGGQFVAFYQGRLIDTDPTFEALFLRVQAKLGNRTVLIRQVTDSPDELYHFRSPRQVHP